MYCRIIPLTHRKWLTCNFCRMFIRLQKSENYLATTLNSQAKFHLFFERALFFHNDSLVTLYYSSSTTILNESPAFL